MHFIFISSSDKDVKGYGQILNRVLLRVEMDYQFYKFDDINNVTDTLRYSSMSKIYVVENSNKIDSREVVRVIRENFNDYKSFIIIINFNKNLKLRKHEVLTSIIEKDNLRLDLITIIKEILKVYEQDKNVIFIKENGVIYRLPFSNILYIEKLPNSKYCEVICKDQSYIVKENLNNLMNRLNKFFVLAHRSACVNINEIETYDYINGVITFATKKSFSQISRDKKKHLIEALTEQDEKFTKQGTK